MGVPIAGRTGPWLSFTRLLPSPIIEPYHPDGEYSQRVAATQSTSTTTRGLKMKRVVVATGLLLLLCLPSAAEMPDLAYMEIGDLQDRMNEGSLTSVELVAFCMQRIAEIDRAGPKLGAVIELNPDAFVIAAKLDQERAQSGPRGSMHGIPVLLKANIDTGDKMETTAGSLALRGHRAPDDAFHVQALRDAGAVILGKTNLHELAYGTTSANPHYGAVQNPWRADHHPGPFPEPRASRSRNPDHNRGPLHC